MTTIKDISKKVVVLDNNGETFDRYTIIFRKTADMYGSSINPFNPQGFSMYISNITTDTYNYRSIRITEKLNRVCVNCYLSECKNIGKRIKDLSTLPIDVQNYIIQLYTDNK